jgi:ABC-type multidrug transport system fused ATPase/permease subunit
VNTSASKWSDFLIVKNSRLHIFIIFFFLVLATYLGFLTPRLISDLYKAYSQSNEEFIHQLILVGVLFVAEYFNRVFYQISLTLYMQKLLRKIRSDSFSKWILSYEAVESNKTRDKYPLGEVISRILNDTEAILELIGSGSFAIFIDFIFIISCLISFIGMNTTSGFYLLLAEIVTCSLLIYGSQFMAKVYIAVRKSTAEMSRTLANVIGGFAQVYYTPNFKFSSKKSLKSFEHFLKVQLRANTWDASYYSVAESLFPLLLAFLVVILPYSQLLEVATLAAMIDLLQRSINPIKDMAGKISNIQRAKVAASRLREFQNDLSSIPSSPLEQTYQPKSMQQLHFNLKEFYYNEDKKDDFSLKDIHFSAKFGELIGIVGLSGSGKSTFLKLLSTEILSPQLEVMIETGDAKIYLNSSILTSISRYRQYVSLVSQDSHVFHETLEFNITFGVKSSRSFTDFWSMVSQQIPYIEKWGVTSSSIIKPNDLSLGQKQLISGLRACYLCKPIVLFDEVSSGLDADLELSLRKLILIIQKHSLTIIVAHRVETIVEANQILILEQGRLTATGVHAELIKSNATYNEFISQVSKL